MKQKCFMRTIIYLIPVIIIAGITKGQNQKFPIGLFAASGNPYPTVDCYDKMKALDADWLIIQPSVSTKARYETDGINIISFKLEKVNGINNHIYRYSGGYYSNWKAKEGIYETGRTGLKLNPGVGEMAGDYWTSKSTTQTGLLLNGPNYAQNKIYRNLPEQGSGIIHYKIRITYKVDELENPPATPKDVCRIIVEYKYKVGTSDHTEEFINTAITTNEATGEFRRKTLEYDFRSIYSEWGQSSQTPIENITGVTYRDDEPGLGLNIRFEYKGESKIYIDAIEVYDNKIGETIIDDPATAQNQIEQYIAAIEPALPSTFKYWYSLDEPQCIDQIEPYRFIRSVLEKYYLIDRLELQKSIGQKQEAGTRQSK